ncbi:MAG: DNA translocase FtsK 4TM domain-containing protein [Rikenellaceae bacterium]
MTNTTTNKPKSGTSKKRTSAVKPRKTTTTPQKNSDKPTPSTADASNRAKQTKKRVAAKKTSILNELSETQRYIIAIVLIAMAMLLALTIISYFYSWRQDQSVNSLNLFAEFSSELTQNSIGRIGAIISNLVVGKWFGIFALCIPCIILSFSFLLFNTASELSRKSILSLFSLMLIGSIAAAHFFPHYHGTFGSSLGGGWGLSIDNWLINIIGVTGGAIIIVMFILIWLIYTSLTTFKLFGKTIKFFFVILGKFLLSLTSIFTVIERIGNKNSTNSPQKGGRRPIKKVSEPEDDLEDSGAIVPALVQQTSNDKSESNLTLEGVSTPLYEIESEEIVENTEISEADKAEEINKHNQQIINSIYANNGVIYNPSNSYIDNQNSDGYQNDSSYIDSMVVNSIIGDSYGDKLGVNKNLDSEFIVQTIEPSDKTDKNNSAVDEEKRDLQPQFFVENRDGSSESDNEITISYVQPQTNSIANEHDMEIERKNDNEDDKSLSGSIPDIIVQTAGSGEIYTDASKIKDDQFEVAITSNTEIDINGATEGENIKIVKNEPSELDDIDISVFDPTLELSSYKLPPVDLLDNHTNRVVVTDQELHDNKNRIIETLNNFGISIDKIKATIGPTVTLYEIKPAPGVRISKIKNLEDDIALSLSALGIRIIAPIPGKGTIGIEVPNKDKEVVSMYSVIKSAKFQDSSCDLPIVLGRTIQNDDFVIDLAKMPHLLVAGATGQGKSVGLNAIITSLLYKKHPSELKLVLVDPKKVELTLYQSIEKHFLAKMEDEEEAIITDTQRVVYTLNSLCIEMDDRYKLLKAAKVRNIKEYNAKFVNRKLNPNNGHRFLPYFVVIIDEFADLIMTAGREIETPIARIAQLARAIGIHLVIATQRPTTNIITGVIKANFPARIAFRVSSMVDSRTIIDGPGANQLIGRGDMLVSTGNETVRVQCAFVDTPEVERITDYIGDQRGYGSPYILPDYAPEGDSKSNDTSKGAVGKLDDKFTEVARYVVQNQQGSASTIQRNFSIGFNRAGRLMDQLERAGIVGKQEGSKPRQVLISEMATLELKLYDMENGNF